MLFPPLILFQDIHVAHALQDLAEVLQKVVENNNAQLREMGSMLCNFAEAPLQPFQELEQDDAGCPRASKSKEKYVTSLALKVQRL